MFLAFWGYEDGVCQEACKLLKDLTFRKETRMALLRQNAFIELVAANSIAIYMGKKPYELAEKDVLLSMNNSMHGLNAQNKNLSEKQLLLLFGRGLNSLPDLYAEEIILSFAGRAMDLTMQPEEVIHYDRWFNLFSRGLKV